ncbi:NAD-dependent epimerase/dehydratase family protein [Mangrovibacterium diazotrophicum]|uniref:Nucleoside-diphosphate-sugar epimerase n=1 Tax=Mangrovibacterium diazotrophicum TaxID=1261403 RepID=A0A419VW43_9BACT|nr:SDR family oxidoreductase [Mangrovibacterium diazotrophicum]RKD86202.1 nucleoside-diphosphate-sugar epimerase [Mangrovibacterium diazotrophicum]
MKILIIGNMGYVGPGVVKQLRQTYPQGELVGYDIGYFANQLTNTEFLPEVKLNQQLFGDVREFPYEILSGFDSVVYLAAISNDPMGAKYEEITLDVNYRSCIKIAEKAKEAKVKSFVFASSCSIYGAADQYAKKETDTKNPLTAYARSKVFAEQDLEPLADANFTVTCLRFATACGMSNRLRLDLVLNDFVAGAVVSKGIDILSDGTPWRPLINVLDMGRAIDWAITRKESNGGQFLAINTGSNVWNYQVKELAEAVAKVVPGCKVTVNQDAPPDKRSYKVNFDLFKELAPNHQPIFDLQSTIEDLFKSLTNIGLKDPKFRDSKYMRLKILASLQENGHLSENLMWNFLKTSENDIHRNEVAGSVCN